MDDESRARILELSDLGRTPRDIVTMTRLSLAEVDAVLDAERQRRLADGPCVYDTFELAEPTSATRRTRAARAPRRAAVGAPALPRKEVESVSLPEPKRAPEPVVVHERELERAVERERLLVQLEALTDRERVLEDELARAQRARAAIETVLEEQAKLIKSKQPRVISEEGRERMRANGRRLGELNRRKAEVRRAALARQTTEL